MDAWAVESRRAAEIIRPVVGAAGRSRQVLVEEMVSETTAVKEKLNTYELIVVLRPDLLEEKLEASIENVKKAATGKGGSIQDTQRWGKRRLAYRIKHFGEGIYILFRLQGNASQNRELENNLKISEDVLRHLLIKTV